MSNTYERIGHDIFSGNEHEQYVHEEALRLDEEEEIEELDAEGQTQTAVAKFEGSPQLPETLSEEKLAKARRDIATAHALGMDAMGAFPPMHFKGGSVVTVDREGIHITGEGDK